MKFSGEVLRFGVKNISERIYLDNFVIKNNKIPVVKYDTVEERKIEDVIGWAKLKKDETGVKAVIELTKDHAASVHALMKNNLPMYSVSAGIGQMTEKKEVYGFSFESLIVSAQNSFDGQEPLTIITEEKKEV